MAIIKITLKTFIEITRLRTLSKSGYQQLQVDVEFARVQLWRLVASEEKLVNSMLDEVMAAAGARCTEPSASMESSVVEKILSHDKAVVE